MVALSPTQEASLDQTGVVVHAYAWFDVPELVFSAPLVAGIQRKKAYVSVEVGTPTVGSLSDITPEMTLDVSINGHADGGRQRVRGVDVDNSRILIGRTGSGYSDGRLDLVHGGVVNVWREYRPFIKAPFISLDTLEQYKDELLYPGADAAQPPVANAGTDRLIITYDASATIELDALGEIPSYAVRNGATLASYSWDIRDGAVVSGDTDEDSLTASFPRGSRWISLTVTDSNGISHTTHRLIVVARPEDCTPVTIEGYNVAADGASLTVKTDASWLPENLPTGAKVIVAERENYGADTLIGYAERFCGWLGEEQASISNPRRRDTPISMTLYDIGYFLKNTYLHPISLNIAEDTGAWYRLKKANIDRMLHHILMWHSNALSLCSFKWSGQGATYPFSALTTSGGSFWQNISNLAVSFGHKLTCDTRGQLRIVGDPHTLPTADQADEHELPTQRPSGVVTTFAEDRYTTMELAARKEPEAFWFQAQAMIAAETVNQVVAVIAPSNAPNTGTSDASRSDLLVTKMAELRVWAANQYSASYSGRIGTLTIKSISPKHFIEPALCDFVAVELPERFADRYNLPPNTSNRWTVESIDYRYDETGKRATYTLRKEIVAPELAKPTEQTDTDSIIQAWSGFDDSIDPLTGNFIRNFEAATMSLTQAQLEQTLRRTWLKVGVGAITLSADGGISVDDNGTDMGGDDGITIGAGSQAEQASRNGGMYEVARRLADFWEKAQTIYTGVEGDPDEQLRFEQFVNATLIDADPTAVTAWWTYINTTPDHTLPSLSYANRASLTGYLYCAATLSSGLTDYVTSLSSSLWDRYFAAMDVITETQMQAWYDAGTDTPINLYSSYGCYTYPPETLQLNTTQIHAETVVQGSAKDWDSRKGGTSNSPTGGSFVYISASGQYEDADYIYDAFYRYDKVTEEVTLMPLTMQGTYLEDSVGGPFVLANNFIFTTPPPYSETGQYGVTGLLNQQDTQSGVAWGVTWPSSRYWLSDERVPAGTGTGSYSVTFTDLGEI